MQDNYNCIEPLWNLYHGIRLKDMELIATNVKSIDKIISPPIEVMKAFDSIK